jgi:hypothetical protein
VVRVRSTLLAAALFACGGTSKPAPAPISNTTSSTTVDTSTGEPARVIMRYSSGGVIELSGDRSRAMAEAEKAMAAHCGADAYTITQEGEEAIKTDTSGATPRTATAWRVHYQCRKLIDI